MSKSQKISFGAFWRISNILEVLKFQRMSLRKESSTDECVSTYHKTHSKNNGSKNQKSKLNTLLDFTSESIKAKRNQNIGIIKVKNHKIHSLFETKKSCQPETSIHQPSWTSFICRLNTKKSKNHIIRPK